MGFAASKCCSKDNVTPDSAAISTGDVAVLVSDDGLALTEANSYTEEASCQDDSSPVALELQRSFSIGTAATIATQLKKSLALVRQTSADSAEAIPEKFVDAPLQAAATKIQKQFRKKNKSAPKKAPPLSSGTLTADEVNMVQKSWMGVEDLGAENVGLLLFKNIFAIEPQCLQKFSFNTAFSSEPGMMNSTKMKRHVTRVVNTVGVAISLIRDLDSLVPVLQGLALKHVGYNIAPLSNAQDKHYYGVVGHALLKTLRQGLGKNFSQELEVAWAKVYTLVADTMITASCQQPPSVQGAP